MLWIIVFVLLAAAGFGFVTSQMTAGFVQALLIAAVALLVIRIVQGRVRI